MLFDYAGIVHYRRRHAIAASLHVSHDLTCLFTPKLQITKLRKIQYSAFFSRNIEWILLESNQRQILITPIGHFLRRISFYGVRVHAINSVERLNLRTARFLWSLIDTGLSFFRHFFLKFSLFLAWMTTCSLIHV